jgi:hypothetical protein
MAIEQKFDTFLKKKRDKIFSKINNFNQLSPNKNWHLFCLLIKRICVIEFSSNFGFGLQKIRFGIYDEGIIRQLHT